MQRAKSKATSALNLFPIKSLKDQTSERKLRRMLRGIFRTKNLDDILASAQQEGHALKRTLGPINITLLGIGAIIGAGIFATVRTAAAGDASRPGVGQPTENR